MSDGRVDARDGGTGVYAAERGVMAEGYVYILTNRPDGTLYIGVTSALVRRVWEHRQGFVEGFTKRYNLKHLVCFEAHAEIATALQRERTMKHWSRQWKIDLIVAKNPSWRDLYEDLL